MLQRFWFQYSFSPYPLRFANGYNKLRASSCSKQNMWRIFLKSSFLMIFVRILHISKTSVTSHSRTVVDALGAADPVADYPPPPPPISYGDVTSWDARLLVRDQISHPHNNRKPLQLSEFRTGSGLARYGEGSPFPDPMNPLSSPAPFSPLILPIPRGCPGHLPRPRGPGGVARGPPGPAGAGPWPRRPVPRPRPHLVSTSAPNHSNMHCHMARVV